jgi:hypothetical protein
MLDFDCSQERALLDLAYDKTVDGIPGVFGLEFDEGLVGRCNTRPIRGRAMICPSGECRDSRVFPGRQIDEHSSRCDSLRAASDTM